MRYFVLAADYDGTLATHGRVDEATIEALEKLRATGRKLVLVTGRELPELSEVFPHLDLFERVVAENGALLYTPQTRGEKPLTAVPPEDFVKRLKERGVEPLEVGRVIVATCEPHEATVLEVIRELGLELHVIFNKGAVMVLPSGVNKATGLSAMLDELGISPHNVVGVGDAENDHAFLELCECSVAVANALPAVKERVDLVTSRTHGAGVAEVIEIVIANDLAELEPKLSRHAILLGHREDGQDETVAPYGTNVLVSGTSGSGKSRLTTGLLERLAAAGYQFLIIDPEGDYSTLEGTLVLGSPQRAPLTEEVIKAIEPVRQNVVVNLLGIALEHRPAFFEQLLPALMKSRGRTGRPHWIVVDEAHHLLAAKRTSDPAKWPGRWEGMLFVTVHPELLLPEILKATDVIVAAGEAPEQTIVAFCKAIGERGPRVRATTLEKGEVLAWRRDTRGEPVKVRVELPRSEHSRHLRKYAEGDLGPDRSFYFRGPDGKLNLRAQNLVLFAQMAEGVDDETWLHHLSQGDYSRWFREAIKDDDLADQAAEIERTLAAAPADESRRAIREAIDSSYTLPSEKPSGDQS
jgi:hydroxymethylpyrimidine pyrophosphatase-like HAD family hydrolase